MNNIEKLSQIYTYLLKKKIINHVYDMRFRFYDEPPFFSYMGLRNPEYKYYANTAFQFTPTGISFHDREKALMCCLMEAVEKISFFFFNIDEMIFATNDKINKPHVDLHVYWDSFIKDNQYPNYQNKPIGWTEGYNCSTSRKGFIPAQLVYPNYSSYMLYEKNKGEPYLIKQRQVLSGSAAGFDHHSTLIRAVYELVERDCKTTFIQANALPQMVNLKKLNDSKVQKIEHILSLYGYKLFVFDITNDLEIPTFLSILLDLSGVGPVANFGIRTGLKIQQTIIGSIEDAFYTRFFDRLEMVKNRSSSQLTCLNGMDIFGHKFNKKVWMNKNLYKKLGYFFKTIPKETSLVPFNGNIKSDLYEYTHIISTLKEKSFEVWYKKQEVKISKDINVLVYKAIIPGLQPQLPGEGNDNIFYSRINSAKDYYKKKGLYG